ncbi:putative Protein VAC14 [Paratrimastix pyriformis]|uniref:Vacuolar protein 14 C-terminal Fig4-binding domain-containing protein n=1 Tax=Paratrimastix pyriformis TaxID=342808 RepID=A0ABQ8UDT2_9EUKA|nr:putative Protein VAC14 [Paratrimastix pyriformis]
MLNAQRPRQEPRSPASDRLFEKRNIASLEIEQIVRNLNNQKKMDDIRRIIRTLTNSFVFSPQPNCRKGGLHGLATVVIALVAVRAPAARNPPHHLITSPLRHLLAACWCLQESSVYLAEVLPPILRCCSDQDSRVRFYAVEALYNACKAAGPHALHFFNEIFDQMSKLSADPDTEVKSACQLLDRAIKELVVGYPQTFDMAKWVPLLAQTTRLMNPFVRQFILAAPPTHDHSSGVPRPRPVNMLLPQPSAVPHTVPQLDALQHLPAYFEGLMGYLADENREIRQQTERVLKEYLGFIKAAPSFDLLPIAQSLILQLGGKDHFTKLVAIRWLRELLVLTAASFHAPLPSGPPSPSSDADPTGAAAQQAPTGSVGGAGPQQVALHPMVALGPGMLRVLLLCTGDQDPELCEAAMEANGELLRLIQRLEISDDHMTTMLQACRSEIESTSASVRLVALHWVAMFYARWPERLASHISELFPVLLRALSDENSKVAKHSMEVLGRVALHSRSYFASFVESLLRLFRTDRHCLLQRAHVIISRLSLSLHPERIFRALARFLEDEQDDPEFAAQMVQSLNIALLTSAEVHPLRVLLHQAASGDPHATSLYQALARTWCHDPVSMLCLALLAKMHHHASLIVKVICEELEMTQDLLMQLDRFIELLESPVYARVASMVAHFFYAAVRAGLPWLADLRNCLMDPSTFPALHTALYGVLMLLPQSGAFHTLHARLSASTAFCQTLLLHQNARALERIEVQVRLALLASRAGGWPLSGAPSAALLSSFAPTDHACPGGACRAPARGHAAVPAPGWRLCGAPTLAASTSTTTLPATGPEPAVGPAQPNLMDPAVFLEHFRAVQRIHQASRDTGPRPPPTAAASPACSRCCFSVSAAVPELRKARLLYPNQRPSDVVPTTEAPAPIGAAPLTPAAATATPASTAPAPIGEGDAPISHHHHRHPHPEHHHHPRPRSSSAATASSTSSSGSTDGGSRSHSDGEGSTGEEDASLPPAPPEVTNLLASGGVPTKKSEEGEEEISASLIGPRSRANSPEPPPQPQAPAHPEPVETTQPPSASKPEEK